MSYNYDQIPDENKREIVQQNTETIFFHIREMAQCLIEAHVNMPFEAYKEWLQVEFNMTYEQARNFIQMAEADEDDDTDAALSEYERRLEREEVRSLYNSNTGVDAEDYRAYIDANAPELLDEE